MISGRMIPFWVKILALVVILLATTLSKAEQTIPSLTSHVTDLTATLSASEITQLEQKLAAFEKARGSQVALLIVPTTQPETIEQYALRVAETWKPGRKGIDDGILLLIAKNDRTLRIEVGYGVEGVLPDAMAKRIIAEIIVPQFKSGNFVAGIDAGIEAILGLIKGESLPLPVSLGDPGRHRLCAYPSLVVSVCSPRLDRLVHRVAVVPLPHRQGLERVVRSPCHRGLT